MSFVNYIKPGDALDVSKVITNFNVGLKVIANDVQPNQIVDRSIVGNARKSGPWKSAQISQPAAPGTWITPAGAAQNLHSNTFTTYTDEPYVVLAGCQVKFTGSPGELVLTIRVDGVAQYKLAWEGGRAPLALGQPVQFYATLPLILEGKAGSPPATTDIALWSELDSGGAATTNWEVRYVQIEVLGVNR